MTTAAAAVTGLRALTVVLLAGLGMTLTLVPPVLVVAVVDDVLARRGFGDTARALTLALVLPAAWLPALALQGGTVTQVPAAMLPLTLIGCVLAAVAVLAGTGRLRVPPARRGLAVSAVLGAALLLPVGAARPALAHDPGQGESAGVAQLTATRSGDRVTLTARTEEACTAATSSPGAQVVGRRAGEVARAPAVPAAVGAGCLYTGTLALPDTGRWFTYLQLTDGPGQVREAWVQLAGGAGAASAVKDVYVAPRLVSTAGRNSVGALLYMAVIALLAASVRLSARPRHNRA